ncbi:translation initiation factor IF-2-like [Onychostruthus taczanowskii]|uniref:translation initiation factor IF-2-like n=1 Tax=Onychostruthus taczanowskii TaxID=356909 RepID=UPI001B80BB27|nr:translation initiation factor IF-2-like [Onychostruthus taczanowskii]
MWRKVEKNFEERVQEGVKPLRGKRVGPAQSARRIQPGQLRSAGAGSADPRLRLPSVPRANPSAGAGRGGRAGAGTAARPAAGPGRAHFLRGGAPRPAPGRLGRPPAGRWPGAARAAAGVTAPGQQVSPDPGAEGEDRRRALPPPRRRRRGGGRRPPPLGGGRRPRSAAFRAGVRGPGPPAPGAAVNRGGLRSVRPDRAAPPGRAHGPRWGARGPRRCRLPTRPVLKHGPRSLARARVRGRRRKPAAQ